MVSRIYSSAPHEQLIWHPASSSAAFQSFSDVKISSTPSATNSGLQIDIRTFSVGDKGAGVIQGSRAASSRIGRKRSGKEEGEESLSEYGQDKQGTTVEQTDLEDRKLTDEILIQEQAIERDPEAFREQVPQLLEPPGSRVEQNGDRQPSEGGFDGSNEALGDDFLPEKEDINEELVSNQVKDPSSIPTSQVAERQPSLNASDGPKEAEKEDEGLLASAATQFVESLPDWLQQGWEEDEDEDVFESVSRMPRHLKGRKAKGMMHVIQEGHSLVSILRNLYSFVMQLPLPNFVAALVLTPLALSLFSSLLYLPDLRGLVVDETTVGYLAQDIRGLRKHEQDERAGRLLASPADSPSFSQAPSLTRLPEEFSGPTERLPRSPAVQEDGEQVPLTLADLAGLDSPYPSLSRVLFPLLMFSLSLTTGLELSLSPASPYCQLITNVNALLAQLMFVFLSGAVFTRLSQPSQPVHCATVAVITPPVSPLLGPPPRSPKSVDPAPSAPRSTASPFQRFLSSLTSSRAATSAVDELRRQMSLPSTKETGTAALASAVDPAHAPSGTSAATSSAVTKNATYRVLQMRFVLSGFQPLELVDVKVDAVLHFNALVGSGAFMRRHTETLTLQRGDMPYLRQGMLLRHVVNSSSPLFGRTQRQMEEENAVINLTVVGLERSSMQPVFHLEEYYAADGDIIWNAYFEDLLVENKKKELFVDHRRLSKWTRTKAGR